MLSYYQLPSTVVDHPKYNTLKAAYSFYNVCTSVSLKQLLNDALITAKKVSTFPGRATSEIFIICIS